MTQWSNAHLMFCEGPHDAAFLNRLLKTQLGFLQKALKLSELPYPISNVFQQSFKNRAAEDMRLDLAKKFFLPDYVVARDSVLVLIFSYGGSNRKISMLPFLENVFALLAAETIFASLNMATTRPNYAFTVFADADAGGAVRARARISEDLATVGESMWLSNVWDNFNATKAVSQHTSFGPVAAYIWSKSEDDCGTLEDMVQECLDGNEGLQMTLTFLDSRFSWTQSTDASPEQVCAVAAKRLKAAFCVEGQKKKPGGSLGVILDQGNLLELEHLEKSLAVQDCVRFLTDWLTSMASESTSTTTV